MITFEKCQMPEMKGDCHTDMWKLIDGFKRSGYECVRLIGWTHKTAKSCADSINIFLGRNRIPFVRVMTRKGEVYLINTLKEDLRNS